MAVDQRLVATLYVKSLIDGWKAQGFSYPRIAATYLGCSTPHAFNIHKKDAGAGQEVIDFIAKKLHRGSIDDFRKVATEWFASPAAARYRAQAMASAASDTDELRAWQKSNRHRSEPAVAAVRGYAKALGRPATARELERIATAAEEAQELAEAIGPPGSAPHRDAAPGGGKGAPKSRIRLNHPPEGEALASPFARTTKPPKRA